ncbi:MAG: hypothetical protein Q8K65_04805 [Alphaproteobacteria bacterium]|nr:hypothetical protein [Alphaproteobacteria bacterium]
MISSVDPAQVPPELQVDYSSYQMGVCCFAGSIVLFFALPMMMIIAVMLGVYGYRRAEKFYPSLEYALNGLFPSAADNRPIAERWTEITAQDEITRPAAARQEEKVSGGGPWVVYIIDAEGVEKTLPRRFETDSAAQKYADLQRVLSRGKISHSGVTYAPES